MAADVRTEHNTMALLEYPVTQCRHLVWMEASICRRREVRTEDGGGGSLMWGHRGGSHALPPRVVMEKKTFAFGLERQVGSRCPITCHLMHICLAINK